MFFTRVASFAAVAVGLAAATGYVFEGETYAVTIYNHCPYTVWPAAQQTDLTVKMSDEYHGSELPSGKNWTLQIPKEAIGVRVWARTGCNDDCSECETGICSGGVLCTDPAYTSKMSLAEFGYSSGMGMTFYDLSIIQGNTIGMQLVPSVSTCETKKCLTSGCALDQAWHTALDTQYSSPADTGCDASADFVLTLCPA